MIGFRIDADDRALTARFDRLPQLVRSRLVEPIRALTEKLLARVIAAEPERTGKLKDETKAFVDEGDTYVRGRVRVVAGDSAEHGKAAALEYGAHGAAKVAAHQMSLDHFYARAMAPREVIVAAYTRQVDIAAQRFLRGAAEGMRDEAMAALDKAIAAATAAA